MFLGHVSRPPPPPVTSARASAAAGTIARNVGNMPELRWHLGYPVVLLAMVLIDLYLFLPPSVDT
jgi:hypothetical protein